MRDTDSFEVVTFKRRQFTELIIILQSNIYSVMLEEKNIWIPCTWKHKDKKDKYLDANALSNKRRNMYWWLRQFVYCIIFVNYIWLNHCWGCPWSLKLVSVFHYEEYVSNKSHSFANSRMYTSVVPSCWNGDLVADT